jgi:hypothetical protein
VIKQNNTADSSPQQPEHNTARTRGDSGPAGSSRQAPAQAGEASSLTAPGAQVLDAEHGLQYGQEHVANSPIISV